MYIIYMYHDFCESYYDSVWWIGIIMEVDEQQSEVKVKFMSPHGPSKSFHGHQETTCVG